MPSPKPLIGITMDVDSPDPSRKNLELPADYPAAILRAGGLPLLLPFTADPSSQQQMIDSIDALLIPGGNDLHPSTYGQSIHPKTNLVDPERQTFDLAMLALAEARNLPILGICMGSQTMNVHRGGTLHQHLPDAQPQSPITHAIKGNHTNFHDLTILPNTKLASLLQLTHLQTNSRHHQGFEALGAGLTPTAHAPDGLIEAFEDPSRPFWLAVQWHPENLPNTPHQRLFDALIQAAATFHAHQR